MHALQTKLKDLDYFPGTVESYCILSKREIGLICILEKQFIPILWSRDLKQLGVSLPTWGIGNDWTHPYPTVGWGDPTNIYSVKARDDKHSTVQETVSYNKYIQPQMSVGPKLRNWFKWIKVRNREAIVGNYFTN